MEDEVQFEEGDRIRKRLTVQRIYFAILRRPVDTAKTSKRVLTVDVHGAGTTDSLTTGAPESERWVDLILDFDQCI